MDMMKGYIKLSLIYIVSLFAVIVSNTSLAQDSPQADSIIAVKVGQSVEGEITIDTDHKYSIGLARNEYVRVNFKSYPLGLIVRVFSPEGHQIQQKWSPEDISDPFSLSFFAEKAGVYEIRILLGHPMRETII